MTGMQPDVVAALSRARALCDLGRWDEALGQLGMVLARHPDDDDAQALMASAHLGKGAFDESLRWSLAALSWNPDNEWAHRLAAVALMNLGRHQEARVAAREALRVAPHSWNGHVLLARALSATPVGLERAWSATPSRFREAREAADRAVALAPDEPEAHRAVGMVAAAETRSLDAIAAFSRALALSPDDSATHGDLGRLALRLSLMGHGAPFGIAEGLAQAAAAFATALRADPRASGTRRSLDLVLDVALGRVAQLVLLIAWVAMLTHTASQWSVARVLPSVLLVFPVVFAATFAARLAPVLRDLVGRLVRRWPNAVAAGMDVVAAALLLAGAMSPGLATVAFKAAAGLATAARLLMWADAAVTSFRRRGRGGGYGDVVGFQAFQEVMVIAFLAAVAAEGRLIGPSVALVVMVAVALLACLAAVSGGSGRNRRARRAAGSL